MDLDDIAFRVKDVLHFNAICSAISPDGVKAAFLEFPDPEDDLKSLDGKWEGYHLVKFATYSKNKIANDEALDIAYNKRGWSVDALPKLASQRGRKKKERIIKIFEGIADAQCISLFECFVNFLDFCSEKNYKFNIFEYSDKILASELIDKKAYLKEKLSHIRSAFDGLHIYWDHPNNEHEQTICKIEPCVGEKHLVIPYTVDNIDIEQPSTVLGWSSRLTNFIGRERKLEQLQAWLNSEAEKSIQFIYGDGGSGKTRLAFEFAEQAEFLGWEAGQATTDLRGRWRLGEKGLLLIIDYPEERETTVKQLSRAVYEMGEIPKGKRLRIILLSRNFKFYDAIDEEAPRLLSKPIFLSNLESEQLYWQLVESSWKGLKKQHIIKHAPQLAPSMPSVVSISENNLRDWLKGNPDHSTPLFIISLVYYLYCEPEAAINFDIKLRGQTIIRYMTKREIKFIRKEVGYYFGLKKFDTLFNIENILLLKAVAAISGGVDIILLQRILIKTQNKKVAVSEISNIKELSVWCQDQIEPVTPSILAADFLAYSLEHYAPNNFHIWIFTAVGLLNTKEISGELIISNLDRLGRLIYDHQIYLSDNSEISNLVKWNWPVQVMASKLEEFSEACMLIASNLCNFQDIFSIYPILISAVTVAAKLENDSLEKAKKK